MQKREPGVYNAGTATLAVSRSSFYVARRRGVQTAADAHFCKTHLAV